MTMQILMLKTVTFLNTKHKHYILCIVVKGKHRLHQFINEMILIFCRMASFVQNEACVIFGKIDSPFLLLTDMI